MAEEIRKDLVPQPAKDNDTSAFDSGARANLKPIGVSGSEIFAGYFSEEYLQQLRGRKGAKIFDEMRRSEPQVSMLLNAVMNPIKAGTWEFEAAPDVENGEMHKEFIEFLFKEGIDWETHLHEALTMFVFGFSIFENIHNVVFNHPKFGTFNGIKALAFRSQKTIERWIIDTATGQLKMVQQWAQGDLVENKSGLLDMNAEFLTIFTLSKEGDNYEGISALRPMYGPWFRKNLYQKIMGIGIEKNAIGTPLGKVPAGTLKQEDFDKFKETLSNFVSHETAYMIIPSGWEIEVIKNDFDPAKVKEVVLMENTEMINSLVANFLALGTNGGGGSFALGTDLSDFFLTGLMNYAQIIAGQHNRKTIPDMIKMNYGPQSAYPKMKVSNINDKAGKELAEVVQYLTNSQAIKPDMKLEEFLRKVYNLPVADVETTREPLKKDQFGNPIVPPPPSNPQLSEKRIILAESYKKQWDIDKKDLKVVMQDGLKNIYEGYKKQIASQWKSATKSQRPKIAMDLQPRGVSDYKNALREALAEIANTALINARKQTPKAKNVKLSESIRLAAPKGGFYEALPKKVKDIVKNQSDLIATTQIGDISKIVSLQYGSSQASTEDVDQVLVDIDDAVLPTLEDGAIGKGMSIDAAAGNAVSSVMNQASLSWFFEPEVLETIESFTFTNEDPVSEVCQELDGTTWAANDPDIDRYTPPLHHNCKSRLTPNEKGADGNPDIQRGGTAISQKALDSITLHECDCTYNLAFELKDQTSK